MSKNGIHVNQEPFADSELDGAQRRLEQLGYKQELNRNLSVTENVVMALSNVSPLMAAFVYALAAFATVGIATAPAAILQGIMKRAVDGTASSARALEQGKRARPLAEMGWQIAQRVATKR